MKKLILLLCFCLPVNAEPSIEYSIGLFEEVSTIKQYEGRTVFSGTIDIFFTENWALSFQHESKFPYHDGDAGFNAVGIRYRGVIKD